MIAVRYLLLTILTSWYYYEGCAQQPLPRLSFDQLSNSGFIDSLTAASRQYYRKLQTLPTTGHNDTLRFKTLFYLGRLYLWRTTSRDSASYLGRELVRQAQLKRNLIFEVAGKYLLAASIQEDESRIQEALRLNLEILALTKISFLSFLNLIDVITYINTGKLYSRLNDSVNSVRFLQEARNRIGYLQQSVPASSTGKKVNATINKLYNSTKDYINADIIKLFVDDINSRLIISGQKDQSSKLVVNPQSQRRVDFLQDQAIYGEITLDRYKLTQEAKYMTINIFYTFLGLFICTVALLIYARRLWKRRAEANRRLTKERLEANARIVQTREAERQRLARDLHDGVGVELAVLRMRLSLLNDHEEDNTVVTAAVGDLDRISREVREVAHALTPAELGQGLVSSLQQLVNRLMAVYPQMEINFMANTLHPIPPATEQVVYAMAKELLNNTLKHAEATIIDVELYTKANRLYLRVGDNGRGYDPQAPNSSGGIGLRNLRATAEELGGRFTVVRKPEGGVVSEIVLVTGTSGT